MSEIQNKTNQDDRNSLIFLKKVFGNTVQSLDGIGRQVQWITLSACQTKGYQIASTRMEFWMN